MAFWPSQHLTAMRCEPLEVGHAVVVLFTAHAFQHLLGPSPAECCRYLGHLTELPPREQVGCHKKPRGTQLAQPEEQRGRLPGSGVVGAGLGLILDKEVSPVEKEGKDTRPRARTLH